MLFVDYHQNARDHPIASACSVCGVPEATVSPLVGWDETDQGDTRQFTIATVPAACGKPEYAGRSAAGRSNRPGGA